MSKRRYTHVKELLPAINKMIEQGKTQREITQSCKITPSISRKGNPYDNVIAENFFSILKTECIYRHKPASLREANAMIDRYIDFYNDERIQTKFGVAPLSLRLSI